jgi:hypothetical protein
MRCNTRGSVVACIDSVWELFMPFSRGQRLVLIADRIVKDPWALIDRSQPFLRPQADAVRDGFFERDLVSTEKPPDRRATARNFELTHHPGRSAAAREGRGRRARARQRDWCHRGCSPGSRRPLASPKTVLPAAREPHGCQDQARQKSDFVTAHWPADAARVIRRRHDRRSYEFHHPGPHVLLRHPGSEARPSFPH